MQAQLKKKRGRPRKNPVQNPVPEVPVVEQIAPVEQQEPEMAPSENPLIVTGIRSCINKRWILADLNGELVKVKCLKAIKTPKHKRIKVQHIEDNFYEEIR